MNLHINTKDEEKLTGLDFDDVAQVTFLVRVIGIQESKDENGETSMSYDLEATVTNVEKEKVSRREALERALNKQKVDPDGIPYMTPRIVPG